MYHSRRLVRLAVFILVLFFSLLPGSTPAAAAPPSQEEPVQVVNVSIFLLGIHDFDQRNGSYIADFYLNLFCEEGQACQLQNFELTNGTVLSKEDQSISEDYHSYRIQARLYSNLDFRDFPFDRQSLTILLEDKILDQEGLVYQAALEETAVDQELQIPGWEISASRAEVDGHFYSSWDQVYSRYRFTLVIERPLLSSLVKGIMPAGLVALVAFFSLFIPTSKALNRLSALTSTFIAGVLLHLNMTNAIPAVSYLTFADRFMLINYVVIAGSLGLSIWSISLLDHGQEGWGARLDRLARILLPGVWVVLQTLSALWLY